MVATLLAVLSLLSGNPNGNGIPRGTPRIDTRATIDWIVDGPDASHRHFVTTALDTRGRSRLLNGDIYGDGNAMVFGAWGASRQKASFVLDLKSLFLVSKVTLWSAEERATRGCARFTVSLSRDGKTFVQLARHDNPADFSPCDSKKDGIRCVPLDCALEQPAVARYVKVVATQHPGRHQMILGEVAVWGEPPPIGVDIEEFSPERRRPTIPLAVDGWSSGAATFSWAGFAGAGDVVKWRFYASDTAFGDIRDKGVKRLAELGPKETSFVVCPLRPKVTRHYAVAAVYDGGECPTVRSVAHAPIGPLEVTRFRDMLGYCFFWGGGGACDHTHKAYYDVAADFLVDIGIRRISWWIAPEWAMRDQYAKRGIEIHGRTGQKDAAAKYGLYLRAAGNEPELTPQTPAECAASYRKMREDWKDMGDDFKYTGPVVNIGSRGFEYLKGFVKAGGAQYLDAIDLHDYCGATSEFVYPKGYPRGSPEAIVPRVEMIRAWLKAEGVEKPLTCSEWGYSDTTTCNPHMEDPTPLRKAQFLVRGCILHHALDFRRLYMYSFYDEGYDYDYTEHCFGVVTRDCQKKPAYRAIKTMVETVGEAKIEAKARGLGEGDYGYVFRNVDKAGCVTVVWNGAKTRRGVFRTKATAVRVVSLFGESRTVKPKADGTFLAKFGASPVYFVADEPVEATKVEDEKVKAVIATDRLRVTTPAAQLVFAAGEQTTVRYTLANPMDEGVVAQVALRNLAGETLVSRQETLAAGATRELALAADMKGAALEQFVLVADYDADGESRRDQCGVWVRQLGARDTAQGIRRVRFANVKEDVVILGNDRLEVSVLPSCGGQILEIFDKQTRRNQIALDYGDVPKLRSIPFAHGAWDSLSFTAPGVKPCGYGRSRAFAAENGANGALRLTARFKGVSVEKTLRLDGNRLSLAVVATNGTPNALTARWHLHPEYLPGGSADSYSDYLLVPIRTGEYKLVYWSGLGDRRMEPLTAGWWRMIDPVAHYEIRQDFDHTRFENLKTWFGIGTWNVELYSKPTPLPVGATVAFSATWQFGP